MILFISKGVMSDFSPLLASFILGICDAGSYFFVKAFFIAQLNFLPIHLLPRENHCIPTLEHWHTENSWKFRCTVCHTEQSVTSRGAPDRNCSGKVRVSGKVMSSGEENDCS